MDGERKLADLLEVAQSDVAREFVKLGHGVLAEEKGVPGSELQVTEDRPPSVELGDEARMGAVDTRRDPLAELAWVGMQSHRASVCQHAEGQSGR